MTTAPRDAVSIAPAPRRSEPSRAFVLVALLGVTLVVSASSGMEGRFGQLVPAAGCLGAEGSVGALTRALDAAAALVPVGALAARGEALWALLAGALAAALHRLWFRVLESVRAVDARRRELLAFGLALSLASIAAGSELAAPSVALALCALGVERALAASGRASHAPRSRRRARAQLLIVLALLGFEWAPTLLAPAAPATSRTSAADPRALDALLDALFDALPPRALLIAGPELQRSACSARYERRLRPDLTLVPPPWRLDARAALALERRDASLRPLLRAQLLDAAPAWAELQALAARRAVLLEPDPTLAPAAARTLLPAGLWLQLVTGDVGKTDLLLAAVAADRTLERLFAQLDPARTEPVLSSWLAATLHAHAAHEAAHGDPVRAARLESMAARWPSMPARP
jgi:hypothetical protein